MKRRLLKLVVLFLLAVTTTWTVAWGRAIFTDINWVYDAHGKNQTIKIGEIYWIFRESSGWGRYKLESEGHHGKNGIKYVAFLESTGFTINHNATKPPYWSTPCTWTDNLDYNSTLGISDLAYGWPFLALRYKFINTGYTSKYVYGRLNFLQTFPSSIKAPTFLKRVSDCEHLPIQPIWWGFIANTLLYSSIWLLLISSPAVLRRMIRRKRGRCIKCGYDLRGMDHDKCPECGWGRDRTSNRSAGSIEKVVSDPSQTCG